MIFARKWLPIVVLLTLTGCGNVFDMVAGIFSDSRPQEEMPNVPAAGETDYAAGLYCFREYQHLKLDEATCRRVGGIMVQHDGRPAREDVPRAQPQIAVQTADLEELPLPMSPTPRPLRESDIFMASPAVRYGETVAAPPTNEGAADSWAPSVTATPRGRPEPEMASRPEPGATRSDPDARCFREARLLLLSEQLCQRVGGHYIPEGEPLPSEGHVAFIKSALTDHGATRRQASFDKPRTPASGNVDVRAGREPRRIAPGRQQESRADIQPIVDMPAASDWEHASSPSVERVALIAVARPVDGPVRAGSTAAGPKKAALDPAPRFLRHWRCVDMSGGILDVPLPECQSVGGTPRKGRLPETLASTETSTRDTLARDALGTPVIARSLAPQAASTEAPVPPQEASRLAVATSGIACLYQRNLRDWSAATCQRLGGEIVPVHAALEQEAAPRNAPTGLERGAALVTRNPDIFMTPAQVAALRRDNPVRSRSGLEPGARPSSVALASQPAPPAGASSLAGASDRAARQAPSRGSHGVVPSAMVAELRRAFPTAPRARPSEARLPTGGKASVALVGAPRDAETPIQDASGVVAPAKRTEVGQDGRKRVPEQACVWDPHLLALSQGACRALGGAPAHAPYDAHLMPLPRTGKSIPLRDDPETELRPKSPRWRQLGMAR